MTRGLRIEENGGLFHVINRGNYRKWLFKTDGAKVGFEKALFETCDRAGWIVHAYCIMGNHYHLALETPRGNLSEGMRLLQSVFANRFNRLRRENGRLFQGRFKSLCVENKERMGWLCHYIHLNPVRAGMCTAQELGGYRWSSSWYWRRKAKRPAFLSFDACLDGAGGLEDTTGGWNRYVRYLTWVAENEPERKRMQFMGMSRGWALGSASFKKALAAANGQDRPQIRLEQKEAREVRELQWEERLERCLTTLGKDREAARKEPKSAGWKVAIAAHMRNRLMSANGWLTAQLHMGVLHGVSRYSAELRAGKRPEAEGPHAILNAKFKE